MSRVSVANDRNSSLSLIQVAHLVTILAALATGPCCFAKNPTAIESYDLVIRDISFADVEARKIVAHQDIGIRAGKIASIGPTGSFTGRVLQELPGRARLALPGFIDTHTHLWQHIARSFEPGAKLQEWVSIYKYAHVLAPRELERLTYIAAKQAELNGITTVSDFASANFRSDSNEASLRALQKAHMGGYHVWWHPAVFLPSDVREAEIRRLRASAAPLDVVMGFAPLSFNVMPLPAVYDGIRVAQAVGMRMTEHTMENLQESRDFRTNITQYVTRYADRLSAADRERLERVKALPALTNSDPYLDLRVSAIRVLANDAAKATPKLSDDDRKALQTISGAPLASEVPLLEYLGALDNFLAIHSVWVTPEDLDIYTKHHVSVSHNPESNMYLSSGVAPIIAYEAHSIPVSLGTDGAASNDGIDMLSAMRFMYQLQKIHELDPDVTSQFTSWDALRSATLQGAVALGQIDRIGSISVGKEADLVLMRTDRLEMAPFPGDHPNDVAIVVNSSESRDIDVVLSDGQIVVQNGRLVGDSEPKLAQALDDISHTAIARTESGYDWHTTYDLSEQAPVYGSVRKPDTLNIQLVNKASSVLCARIAFSGRTFGGTAPAMLGSQTLSRFPLDSDSSDTFTDWYVRVPRESPVSLTKAHASWIYQLRGVFEGARTREGRAEQILIMRVADDACQ